MQFMNGLQIQEDLKLIWLCINVIQHKQNAWSQSESFYCLFGFLKHLSKCTLCTKFMNLLQLYNNSHIHSTRHTLLKSDSTYRVLRLFIKKWTKKNLSYIQPHREMKLFLCVMINIIFKKMIKNYQNIAKDQRIDQSTFWFSTLVEYFRQLVGCFGLQPFSGAFLGVYFDNEIIITYRNYFISQWAGILDRYFLSIF